MVLWLRRCLPVLMGLALSIAHPLGANDFAAPPASPNSAAAALHAEAERLYLEGDLQGAEQLFLEIADAPQLSAEERAEALVTAAWLQYLRRLEDAALLSLERALALDSATAVDESLFDASFAALATRARDTLERTRREQARQLLATARQQLRNGELAAARGGLERVLSMKGGGEIEIHAFYSLGLLEMKAGDDSAAQLRFEEVLSITPTPELRLLQAAAHINLGTILFRQGLLAKAELSWERATELDPDAAAAWKNLGLVRAERKNYVDALPPLQLAHQLEPDNIETARLLARVLTQTGAHDGAVSVLQGALDRTPNEPLLWLALGSALRNGNRHGPAESALEKAVALDPSNRAKAVGSAAALLSLIATENKQYDRAERWARTALQWEAHVADHWNSLAIALRGQDRLEEAEQSLRQAVALDPARPEFAANLGSVLLTLGRTDEAETALETALGLDPTSVVVADSLAQIRAQREAEQARSASAAAASPTSSPPRAIAPKKLGVRFIELDYDRLGLRGALVREVAKRSPAARTGLRRGDLVLRVGGHKVLDNRDFFNHLKRHPPREGMEIEILRDATIETLTLHLE